MWLHIVSLSRYTVASWSIYHFIFAFLVLHSLPGKGHVDSLCWGDCRTTLCGHLQGSHIDREPFQLSFIADRTSHSWAKEFFVPSKYHYYHFLEINSLGLELLQKEGVCRDTAFLHGCVSVCTCVYVFSCSISVTWNSPQALIQHAEQFLERTNRVEVSKKKINDPQKITS